MESGLFKLVAASIGRYGKENTFQALKPFFLSSDLFERTFDKRNILIFAFGEYQNNYSIPLLRDAFKILPFFREKKNTAFRTVTLHALARIGTNEAMFTIAELSKKGTTITRLTGEGLLEVAKKNE